jgi:hypothetical protein
MRNYRVRRAHIGTSEQLDELAQECGRLYSQVLASFWRSVRHKGIWLKPKHLMRWHSSNKLHAHTSDACVQAFFASLQSWRVRDLRQTTDVGHTNNQKIHQWSAGSVRFKLTYKAQHLGMEVIAREEREAAPL